MDSIYLDHNSTTPIAPEVAEAMAECYRAGYANPASQHGPGRTARRRLEEARDGIAQILGAKTGGMDADQVILTSGGTEANNLALRGLASDSNLRVIISSIEHPSIVGPAEHLAQHGCQLQRLRVSPAGVVEVEHLQMLLARDPGEATHSIVSVMLGNNETGVLQPVGELAATCRLHTPTPPGRLLFHTDAVQVAGKLPVSFRELGVDAMTVSAHKFHGPRGIGALIVRHGVTVERLLQGGFQQGGLRPGTEDVALAVGMFTALKTWQCEAAERAARILKLRDRFESQLCAGDPSIVVNGAPAERLPHTSNLSFPGLDRQALVMALDLAGVACSTGSACASGSSEPSPVLQAMGCDEAVVAGSLRFSLGATTDAAQIDNAVRRILLVTNDLRRRKNPAFGR